MRILLVAHNTVKVGFANFIDMSTAFASETKWPFFFFSLDYLVQFAAGTFAAVERSDLPLAGWIQRPLGHQAQVRTCVVVASLDLHPCCATVAHSYL